MVLKDLVTPPCGISSLFAKCGENFYFCARLFMDSSTNLKQVGEVIETLIRIKDSLYSELTFE